MLSAEAIWSMSRAQLWQLLCDGHPVSDGALDDREYRGVSLGLPVWVEKATWKVFRKVFHRDPRDAGLRGWNVRLEQRGLNAASVPRMRNGSPWSFGHFRVVAPDVSRAPQGSTRGVMLDYGRGENHWLDPIGTLRDPVVAVRAGSADLLLGWSYVDLGVGTVRTPSFFTLEYERPLGSHRPTPPGRRSR